MKLNRSFLKLLLAIGVLVYSNHTFSQTNTAIAADSTSQEQKRLVFGVGFGLNFVGGTNISLSPNLIYKVSDKVSFGVGIQGSYAAIKDLQNTTTFGPM